MKPIPTSLSNNITFLFGRVARLALEAHEQALAPLKLSARDFNMLALLAGDGPYSQQDLARCYKVDKQTMKELVDGLEERDLLTRVVDEHDRRSNLLYITVKGKKVHAQGKRLSDKHQKQFLSALSPEEWQQVQASLTKLIESHMHEED